MVSFSRWDFDDEWEHVHAGDIYLSNRTGRERTVIASHINCIDFSDGGRVARDANGVPYGHQRIAVKELDGTMNRRDPK